MNHYDELAKIVMNREVLLIAPGKSSIREVDKIQEYVKKNSPIVISINFEYELCKLDFVFISNLRRYRQLDKNVEDKCIVTSNIPCDNAYLKVKYADLINDVDYVTDNAGLMIIKLLIKMGVKDISLSGFDGYSELNYENYSEDSMILNQSPSVSYKLNYGIIKMLKEYSKHVKFKFITSARNIILA